MKTCLAIVFGLLLSASTAFAQLSGQPKTLLLAANPAGGCANGLFALNLTANTLWVCSSGAWQAVGGVAAFPRLDQILDPNAAKTFTMGTNRLTFDWGATTGGNSNFLELNFNQSTAPYSGVGIFPFFDTSPSTDERVAFYSNPQFRGNGITDRYVNIFAQGTNDPAGPFTGTLTEYIEFLADSEFNISGTVSSYKGFATQHFNNMQYGEVYDFYGGPSSPFVSVGGGEYGVFISDKTKGTSRFSIKTGLAAFGGNSLGDRLIVRSNAAAVQPITFTGAGLNDATSGGTYTGTSDLAYCAIIDASVPSPDTFSWGTPASVCTSGAAGVAITAGVAQNLSNGVQITFAAGDGHTIGDRWDFTAYAPVPLTIQNSSGTPVAYVKGTGALVVGSDTYANIVTSGTSGTANGTIIYCTNCDTPAAQGDACSATGDTAGAEAHRVRAAWKCY